MRLTETDRECEARACEYGKKKRASGCEADIVFLHSLTSMRLSETDRECGARACEYGKKKRTSGCEAKETYGTKKSK